MAANILGIEFPYNQREEVMAWSEGASLIEIMCGLEL